MKQRIFIQTQGGLGNQLFQANFAHHLAQNFTDHQVYVIDGSVGNDRDYALASIMDSCPHVKSSWLGNSLGKYFIQVLYGLRRRFPNFLLCIFQIYVPKNPYGNSLDLVDTIRKNNLSKLIFIRGDFISRTIPISKCLLAKIRNSGNITGQVKPKRWDVVVHIRRGDYLNNKNYGPLSLRYFEDILDKLRDGSQVLIHTDDEAYVKKNLNTLQEFCVKGENYSPIELIRDSGASRCFIGSNSTLSWWAAEYLGSENSDSPPVIIMPLLWLRNEIKPNYGLLNPDWSLINPAWDK